MNIGIDARMYGPKHGGIGRYVQQIIAQFDARRPDEHIILFVLPENAKTISVISPDIHIVPVDIPWYSLSEQIKLPNILKSHDIDIMLFPHWNIPVTYNRPYIVVIHDLIMYHHSRREATTKSLLTYNIKHVLHKYVVRHAAHAAEHIIVPSQWTKQDVVKTLKVNTKDVTVVYEGITAMPPVKKQTPDTPYFLYVGSAYPHKNISGLLNAWEAFLKQESGYNLIIAGKQDRFLERLVHSKQYKQSKKVEIIPNPTDDQLGALYAQASAFVFPSLIEGFGLPPLEAMQYHIPIVSSSRSCMPEILGEAAIYADPDDARAFAQAMQTAVSDEGVRQEIIRQGYTEIKRYHWDKTAGEILALLRQYHNKKR